MIKISESTLGTAEKEAALRVIEQGYLGMGGETRAFEAELKAFIDPASPPHLATVSTGTSALQLALQAVGIGPGDEVLVPTLTYVASFQAISAAGATPVAVDVSPHTGFMCVHDAARRLTPRTKALMPVHYASGTGDLAGIYALAHQHGLRVIEDAAHSFGGFYAGKRIGATGDIVCFSFDSIKNLTCGEGGAVVSRDAAVIDRVADLRLLGVAKDSAMRFQGKRSFDFDVCEQGWRYHLSNMNAAIGRAQLPQVDGFGLRRRAVFQTYVDQIPQTIGRPIALDLPNSIPHPYVLLLSDAFANQRDDLRAYLLDHGIETGLHYKPNHLLSFYAKPDQAPFPVAMDMWRRMVTVPLHANLSDVAVQKVCECIRTWAVDGV